MKFLIPQVIGYSILTATALLAAPAKERTPWVDPLEKLFVGAELQSPIQDVTAEKAGGTVSRPVDASSEYQVWAAFFKLKNGLEVVAERTYLVTRGDQSSHSHTPPPLRALDEKSGGTLVFATALIRGDVSAQFRSQPLHSEKLTVFGIGLHEENEQGWYKGHFEPETPLDFYRKMNQIRASKQSPDYVEPNFLFTVSGAPASSAGEAAAASTGDCDPKQWNLSTIKATDAWAFYGNTTSAIATEFSIGVQTNHPDLLTNIDKTDGKNFISGTSLEDPHGHGTRVAGVLGAKGGNGVGICGLCWSIKIAPYVVMKLDAMGNPQGQSDAVATAGDWLFDHHNPTSGGARVPIALHSYGLVDFSLKVFGAITRDRPNTSAPVPTDGAVTAWWDANSRKLKLKGDPAEIAKVVPAMPIASAGNINPNSVVLRTYQDPVLAITIVILSSPPAIASVPESQPVPVTFTAPLQSIPYGTLHIAPAGGPDVLDSDENPRFPAAFPSPLVVSVGGSDTGVNSSGVVVGEKPSHSFFGHYTVDLFAPGVSIYTTNRLSTYGTYDGAEFSAAQVAGALMLYYAQTANAAKTPQQGRDALTKLGIDVLPTLQGQCVTGGRLNVLKLLTPP